MINIPHFKIIVFVCTALLAASCAENQKHQGPNLILILIDDLGWKDVGYAGSTYYQTPNIDRLAGNGLIFSNAYSSSPVCSPSRGALLTGKNPALTQFTCVFGNHVPVGDSLYAVSRNAGSGTNLYSEALHRHAVPRDVKMLSKNIRQAGYQTAFFGKWHCGSGDGYLPLDRGFRQASGYRPVHSSTRGHYVASFDGNLAGMEGYPDSTYISEALTTQCVEFMTRQKNQPFMVVLSHYLVHRPLQALPALEQKYRNSPTTDQQKPKYAAMVESVDRSVGRVVRALDSLGLTENTMVVFTSDNGGLAPKSTSNYPLMGGKSYPFEAGMKVPLIFSWPGTIPAGQTRERAIGTDILPTFMDAAGIRSDLGQVITGRSLQPVFKGEPLTERPLIFHFPHYTHATGPFSSIIFQDWKLIRFYNDEDGSHLLYNLAEDPFEQNDLSDSDTSRVDALQTLLDDKLKSWDAEYPVVNEHYIPGAPGNQNRRTTLKMALDERTMFEERLQDKGLSDRIQN